jgi:hypothetical protein
MWDETRDSTFWNRFIKDRITRLSLQKGIVWYVSAKASLFDGSNKKKSNKKESSEWDFIPRSRNHASRHWPIKQFRARRESGLAWLVWFVFPTPDVFGAICSVSLWLEAVRFKTRISLFVALYMEINIAMDEGSISYYEHQGKAFRNYKKFQSPLGWCLMAA